MLHNSHMVESQQNPAKIDIDEVMMVRKVFVR